MFKKTVLDNGLRIITAPMQGTNTVTVLVLCGTGSDYESKEINGISHFLEHMFFKGTKKRPAPDIIAEELDGMGSVHNAFTSHELTGYFIKAGKGYLGDSFDILADIYKNPLLKIEEVEKEKQVIIEELHKDRDNPMRHIWDVWEELLYGDQPAGWDVGGDESTVRSVTQEVLFDYFYHQYVVLNTAVVVAGNFDEQDAMAAVRAHFKGVRDGEPIRKKPTVIEKQKYPEVHIFDKPTDQTHLIAGFRGYSALHPQRYAVEVLGVILGGGMSSRMFDRIREKLGLAYAVWSAHESYSNRGFLTTYAGVDHGNVERTITAILEEYRKVFEKPVPEKELKRVKDYIRGTTLMGLEQSNAVASFVGTEEMVTGKPMTIDEVFAKIDAVTIEDIAVVARDIMKPERLNLAMIGPHREKDKFKKLLTEF